MVVCQDGGLSGLWSLRVVVCHGLSESVAADCAPLSAGRPLIYGLRVRLSTPQINRGGFFVFLFFRFLYRRSSAILSWSSTYVLSWITGAPF